MRRRACLLFALTLAAALPLLAGAGAAPAAPKSAATVGLRYDAVITGFQISGEEKWGWSVTNMNNNSGWEATTGLATWNAHLNKEFLPSKRMFSLFWSATGSGLKLVTNTIDIPVPEPQYRIETETKAEQAPNQSSCNGGGEINTRDMYLSVEAGPRENGHSTLVILWPDLNALGTGRSPCGLHPINASSSSKWFKSVVPMPKLTGHSTVTLHADNEVPVVPTSTDDCYGCIGFKGHGSLTWSATITLRRTD